MSSFGQSNYNLQTAITATGTQTISVFNGSVNCIQVTGEIQNPGTTVARMFTTIGVVSGGTISETLAVVGVGLPASGYMSGQLASIPNLNIPANGTLAAVNTVANIGSMVGFMWINVFGSAN